MTPSEARTIDVNLDAVHAEGNTLRGHAAVFNVTSEDLGGFRERIAPGAFAGVLDADVRLLVNHKPDNVLARTKSGTLRLTQDDTGLAVEADLPDTGHARDLRESLKRRDVDGMSFRFEVGEEEWDGNVRIVKTVSKLHDVCLATYPAYPSASVELRTRPERKDHDMNDRDQGGGLAVEDRTAAPADEPTIEERVVDALRSIRKGESRSLTTTSAAAITPDDVSTYLFDRLRARSVMLAAGVPVVATDLDSIQWPKLSADVTPAWYNELEAITPGDPTFVTLTATPRKLAHLVQLSNEVIDDSEPSIVDVLNAHLAAMLALRLDYFLLEGNGTAPQVRGIKNVSGIQTVSMGANGAALQTSTRSPTRSVCSRPRTCRDRM